MKYLLTLSIIILQTSSLFAHTNNTLFIVNTPHSHLTKVKISTNSEQCYVSLNKEGYIAKTTCRVLTNSKNIKILCTKRKKICKTLDEINEYIYSQSIQTNGNFQNCYDNASTNVQMKDCANREYEYQDKLLNKYYKIALHKLSLYEQNLLKIEQRAWLKYIDAKCNADARDMRGGSGESLLFSGCITEMTKKRVKELKDIRFY